MYCMYIPENYDAASSWHIVGVLKYFSSGWIHVKYFPRWPFINTSLFASFLKRQIPWSLNDCNWKGKFEEHHSIKDLQNLACRSGSSNGDGEESKWSVVHVNGRIRVNLLTGRELKFLRCKISPRLFENYQWIYHNILPSSNKWSWLDTGHWPKGMHWVTSTFRSEAITAKSKGNETLYRWSPGKENPLLFIGATHKKGRNNFLNARR